MHQSTKIEQKEKATDHAMGKANAVANGVAAQCSSCKIMLICARGYGYGKSAIFLAFCRLTIPRETSWNARDKIGGATGRTPVCW
mmetsp:Transcript_142960/g.247764  ORF Transcript_142960/g.247764 Transcript_142960/m.247764 type:complete len:85 (-) Transcript_142960:25-279(-)